MIEDESQVISDVEKLLDEFNADNLEKFVDHLNFLVKKRARSLCADIGRGIKIQMEYFPKLFLEQIEIGHFSSSDTKISVKGLGENLVISGIEEFRINSELYDICINLDAIKLRKKEKTKISAPGLESGASSSKSHNEWYSNYMK